MRLDDAIAQEKEEIIGSIKGSDVYRIVLEMFSGGTKNTPAQLQCLSSLEEAIGIFSLASLELRKAMDILSLEQRLSHLEPDTAEHDELQSRISEAVFLSNRYALQIAGYTGLALLGGSKAETTKNLTFGMYDTSKNRQQLSGMLASQVASDLRLLRSEKDDETLRFALEAIYTTWINQFQYDTHKDIAAREGIGGMAIQYKGYTMKDGVFSQRFDVVDVDEKFMDVTREDVVGNTEMGQVLWNNMLKLAAYDPERKENPYDPAGVIFMYGDPGTGKTFTVHGYVQSLADLCRQKGIPLWAFTHSTTDYASHFQNKTANELAALAEKINSFPGIVLMYVADADNIFLSRKDERLSAEQRQTLSVYFRMFDGSLIPRNGKFVSIMDANYIDGIDDATKSRLFDEIVHAQRFTDAADFAELSKRILTKGGNKEYMPAEDWQSIGEYFLASPLNNREITHICRQIRREFTVPEDLIGRPYAEHVAYRDEQLGRLITRENIISQAENYIKSRMEIERRSGEAKLMDGLQRFLSYLEVEHPPGSDAA